jgi:hypothetical protein
LIVGNFVAGFVDAQKGEVAVLPDFAVLSAVDKERCVAGGAEFGSVGVVYRQRNGLATEPLGVLARGYMWDEGEA